MSKTLLIVKFLFFSALAGLFAFGMHDSISGNTPFYVGLISAAGVLGCVWASIDTYGQIEYSKEEKESSKMTESDYRHMADEDSDEWEEEFDDHYLDELDDDMDEAEEFDDASVVDEPAEPPKPSFAYVAPWNDYVGTDDRKQFLSMMYEHYKNSIGYASEAELEKIDATIKQHDMHVEWRRFIKRQSGSCSDENCSSCVNTRKMVEMGA